MQSEEETAQSLTETIVTTLESKFDTRIQALEHIVLRQEEELRDVKGRMKSLGRLEQQANDMEDRLVSLNRELGAKQAYLDRLGAEQGLIRKSCEQNFQAIAEEGTSQEVAIKNLQSALEKKSLNMSRISVNESLGCRYVSADTCNRMIEQEVKRTIKLMSDQFDDLASFVHSTLDCQTSLIGQIQAKVLQRSGLDPAMPEGDAPNFETISRQTITNTSEIQKLKEDHEVSVAMFVETMASMKMKYDAFADDHQTLNRVGSGESKPSCNTTTFPKASEYKNDIKKIHAAIRVLSKETDAIARDADEMKEILEDAIQSLANSSKETADRFQRKTDKLEKRLDEEFTSVQKHKDLERVMKQSVMMLEEKIPYGEKPEEQDHRFPGHIMIGAPTPVASNRRETLLPVRKSRFEGELIDLTSMANIVY